MPGLKCRFERVVLCVDKSNAVRPRHPDGARIGVGEAPSQAKRLIHDFIEVLSTCKFRTQRADFCEALTLFAKQLIHRKEFAIRSINFRVASHQFCLAIRQGAHSTIAVALRSTHAGVVTNARHQLQGIGQFHQVIIGTGTKALLLDDRVRMRRQHHQRRIGKIRGRTNADDLLHAVNARHHQVLQDDVGASAQRQGVAGVGILRGGKFDVRERGQESAHRFADHRLIVYKEDERLGLRYWLCRGDCHDAIVSAVSRK